jgi:hypothetical protein
MKKKAPFGLIDFEEKSNQRGYFFMNIINNKTFFEKITQVITGTTVSKVIKKYNSDYRVQHFDTLSHLNSMLFFEFKGLSSLRDLQTQTANSNKLRKLINVPSVSQFSRKNAQRDYRIFEDLYYYIVKYAFNKFGQVRLQKELPVLKIIDSTMIDLPYKLAKLLQYDHKQKRSAIKVSTLFNGEYPEKIHVVHGKTNDRKCIDDMIKDKKAIYLFDRGYFDFKWYDKLTDDGYKFITRQPSHLCIEEIKSTYVRDDLIFDYEITMGTDYSKNKTRNTYREILTFDENEEEVRILTNIFDMPAKDFLNLYRFRWQIELFFKWIKQNLKIKHCLGYNENSIKIQLYTALIVYLLLYILQKDIGNKVSMLAVTRIVRANLLERIEEVQMFLSSA